MLHVTVEEAGKSPDLWGAGWRPGSWGVGVSLSPKPREPEHRDAHGGRGAGEDRVPAQQSGTGGLTALSALSGPPWMSPTLTALLSVQIQV